MTPQENGSEPAHPQSCAFHPAHGVVTLGSYGPDGSGMTKREAMATQLAAGMCAYTDSADGYDVSKIPSLAVKTADALLEQLAIPASKNKLLLAAARVAYQLALEDEALTDLRYELKAVGITPENWSKP